MRFRVTEQPYKIPYYATILRLLYDVPAVGSGETAELSLGRQVLDDLWKGFQAYLDKLAWRETRLCVSFAVNVPPHFTYVGRRFNFLRTSPPRKWCLLRLCLTCYVLSVQFWTSLESRTAEQRKLHCARRKA